MKVDCVLVDDEDPALQLLINYAAKVPFINVKFATNDAVEAINFIENNKVDLVFLDIEMPDVNGINFVKTVTKSPHIIFTTAYDKYAVNGFELDVVDYLLKPFSFDRFLRAANKTLKLVQGESTRGTEDTFIWIKVDYQFKKLEIQDILYIEGLKDYVKIYTANGLLMTKLNLKQIHAKIPHERFMRVHKSFIVSLSKVDSVQKAKISISSREIPISEKKWEELSERLKM